MSKNVVRELIAGIVLSCFMTGAVGVSAQEVTAPVAAEPVVVAPTTAPPPVAAPVIVANVQPGPHCILGENHGVETNDATSAASFVCEALVERGVSVGALKLPDPSLGGDRFVVKLRKLGTLWFVELERISPDGTEVGGARMQLSGIEEMVNAGPRLVASVLEGRSIEETQAHDNLTRADVDEDIHSEKRSRMKFGGGVTALTLLGGSSPAYAVGVEGDLFFQSQQFGIGFIGRAGLNVDSDAAAFLNASLAARYFFLPDEISPFAGGGVGLYAIAVNRDIDDAGADGNFGLGAHGEFGVEFMRFSQTRIGVLGRVDGPFFKFGDDYLLPVSLTAYMLIR